MRILFLTPGPPWPPRRGYQARTAGFAEELAARHEISVLAQQPPGFVAGEPPSGIRQQLVHLSRSRQAFSLAIAPPELPWQVALHDQGALRKALRREIDHFQPHLVVIVLSRLGRLVREISGLPVILDLVDCLGLNMAHRAARQPLLRPLLRREGRRMLAWDRALIRRVAATIVVSERDRRALIEPEHLEVPGQGEGEALTHHLQVVPFGLRVGEREPTREERRPVILLSGNLGYFPTVDGAHWFLEKVWPTVRSRRPDSELWLAGSRLGRRLARVAKEAGARLILDPPDLGEVRRQASIAIAPLHAGSGTPIKILEAMAAGLPVVTTPAGAAGLDGLRGGEIAVAKSGDAFAEAVLGLLGDAAEARQQGTKAWRWVKQRHDLKAVAHRFEELLRAVC